jgi:hypothetical protein
MTTRRLRVYTDAGLEEFTRQWKNAESSGKILDVEDMLEDERWTKPITDEPVVDFHDFPTRRECAQYFLTLLNENEAALRTAQVDPATSVHLWTWLISVWSKWLQQLKGKQILLGAPARWIFMPSKWNRYYRHLLAGPYLIAVAHQHNLQNAQILLYNDVRKPNTAWVEQICGRREIVSNGTLLGALSQAVIHPGTQKPRPGTSALTRGKKYFESRGITEAGTIRRLTKVHNQLMQPWHLPKATVEQLEELFGTEFNKFFGS